jgi:hypothetical protein
VTHLTANRPHYVDTIKWMAYSVPQWRDTPPLERPLRGPKGEAVSKPNSEQEPEATEGPKHAAVEEAEPKKKTYFLGISNEKEADRAKKAVIVGTITLATLPIAPLVAAGAAVGGVVSWLLDDDDDE